MFLYYLIWFFLQQDAFICILTQCLNRKNMAYHNLCRMALNVSFIPLEDFFLFAAKEITPTSLMLVM